MDSRPTLSRGDPLYHLGALRRGRTAAGEQTSLPACFEDFLKLVEGAFAGAPDSATNGAAARTSGHSRESGNPLGEGEAPLTADATQGRGGPGAPGDCAAEIRELAEALWERLQVFRVESEREKEQLRQQVEEYLARFDPARREEEPSPRVTLHGLVALFQKGEKAFPRADSLDYRVELALYALLLKRFGPPEEVEDFQPGRPVDHTSNFLVLAILANSRGAVELSDEYVAEYHRRAAQYHANLKRWKELDALSRGKPG